MLQIWFWLWECTIYQNRLRFAKVIDKSLQPHFFMPHSVYHSLSAMQMLDVVSVWNSTKPRELQWSCCEKEADITSFFCYSDCIAHNSPVDYVISYCHMTKSSMLPSSVKIESCHTCHKSYCILVNVTGSYNISMFHDL